MKPIRVLSGVVVLVLAVLAMAANAPEFPEGEVRPAHPLKWDAMHKTKPAKYGDGAVEFQFSVKNTSEEAVKILEVRPSCGCTVADLPATPWIIQPGGEGSFRATVDVRGRRGHFSKTMLVASNAGAQILGLTVDIEDPPVRSRAENLQLAAADRQAVFHGTCYSCHVDPIGGKQGEKLFNAACAICHEANPRATMVPDLKVAKEPRDAAYWRKWIGEGKEGTLMPAFHEQHGGPLSNAQVESLVEFGLRHFPTAPAAK
jgi:mono/diheme cytochrome c family protein